MTANSSQSSNGLGLGTVLTIVFVVLKLCGVIAWSWWWVTAPLWGPFIVVIVIYLVVVLIAALVTALAAGTVQKAKPSPVLRRV